MNAIELIKAERERQVSAHGYNATHDDEHTSGELAAAAGCYADYAAYVVVHEHHCPLVPQNKRPSHNWPWTGECWRPSEDAIRNLVKAGALIVAEIDRLQRANKLENVPHDLPGTRGTPDADGKGDA